MTGGRSCQSSSNRLASEGLLVFIPILHTKINRTMKIGIVVATHGRATLVRELLERMQSQSRLPDEVVLSAVESSDLPELTKLDFPVKVLTGILDAHVGDPHFHGHGLPRSDIEPEPTADGGIPNRGG